MEEAQLRFLRRLVTVLTAVMILGIALIVVLLALRLTAAPSDLALPERVTLPEGAAPLAITAAPGWYAVVTTDGRLLVYDRESGALRREIEIE